jgi:hypothetical protein
MEAPFFVLAFMMGLFALGAFSITWGVESRETYLDDRRR